jgi:hypothetical protein
MSASTDAVQAILSRIRESRRMTRANIEALVDATIEDQTAAFVRDAQQAGHTAKEIESVIEAQRAMLATWRRDTLADMLNDERFGSSSGDAPTGTRQ